MKQKRQNFLEIILDRIDNNFNLANLKASFLIPTNGIFIGILITGYVGIEKNISSTRAEICIKCLVAFTILVFLASTLCALKVVFAFLKSGNLGQYHSLLYFGSISQMGKEEFIEKLKNTTTEKNSNDLAEQIHLLSKALKTKYIELNWAVGLTAVGVFMFCIIGAIILFI